MAAVLQGQIHKFEQATKPYLYEGPFASYLGLIEQKAPVKRDQIALGLLGVVALYLALGWGNDFLCNLIGFLYPAYASLLAVESNLTHDDNTKWIVYWVIYASLGFFEYLGSNLIQSVVVYWLAKSIFLIWLMVPGPANGTNLLYQRAIRPFLPTSHATVLKSSPVNESYRGNYPSSFNE